MLWQALHTIGTSDGAGCPPKQASHLSEKTEKELKNCEESTNRDRAYALSLFADCSQQHKVLYNTGITYFQVI